jgi:hypothetical protein
MYVDPHVGSVVGLQTLNRAGAKSTESRCPRPVPSPVLGLPIGWGGFE